VPDEHEDEDDEDDEEEEGEEGEEVEESRGSSLLLILLGVGALVLVCVFLGMLTIYPANVALRMTACVVLLGGLLGCVAGALWAAGVMMSIDPGKGTLMLLILPLGLQLIPNLSEEQQAKFTPPADCIKWSLVAMLVAGAVMTIEGFFNMKWV
jgi:hypothetical protein